MAICMPQASFLEKASHAGEPMGGLEEMRPILRKRKRFKRILTNKRRQGEHKQ